MILVKKKKNSFTLNLSNDLRILLTNKNWITNDFLVSFFDTPSFSLLWLIKLYKITSFDIPQCYIHLNSPSTWLIRFYWIFPSVSSSSILYFFPNICQLFNNFLSRFSTENSFMLFIPSNLFFVSFLNISPNISTRRKSILVLEKDLKVKTFYSIKKTLSRWSNALKI